jgi:hypothetical protein
MVRGYVLVEGIRVGTRLAELRLNLASIERYPVEGSTTDQPSIWTTVEFDFEEADSELVAAKLADILAVEGGWYTNFTTRDETFVIFANRIFRYHPGDQAGRSRAASYGRSVGVPDHQLDWEE